MRRAIEEQVPLVLAGHVAGRVGGQASDHQRRPCHTPRGAHKLLPPTALTAQGVTWPRLGHIRGSTSWAAATSPSEPGGARGGTDDTPGAARAHPARRDDPVLDRGRHGRPTVVLLHGATLDHRAWAPQIDALPERFHSSSPTCGPTALDRRVRLRGRGRRRRRPARRAPRRAGGAGRAQPGREHRPGGGVPRPGPGERRGGRRRHLQHRGASPVGRGDDRRHAELRTPCSPVTISPITPPTSSPWTPVRGTSSPSTRTARTRRPSRS